MVGHVCETKGNDVLDAESASPALRRYFINKLDKPNNIMG